MAQTITLSVEGMTCDHCVNAVTNALKEVSGVTEATASLGEKRATVEGEGVDTSALIAAVEEEGYEAAVRA